MKDLFVSCLVTIPAPVQFGKESASNNEEASQTRTPVLPRLIRNLALASSSKANLTSGNSVINIMPGNRQVNEIRYYE